MASTNKARHFLTRQEILKVQPRTLSVEIPEWGGFVLFQELPAAEVERIRQIQDPQKYKAALVAACVIDQGGNRLFNDSDIDLMVETLGWVALQRASDVAIMLHKYDQGDLAKLVQNFTITPGEDLHSA
jgi:hypothetical protein